MFNMKRLASFKGHNPFIETDFYKAIHRLAYVPSLDYLVSYWTPRMSRFDGIWKIDKVVMFSLQAFIKEHLIYDFNTYFFNRPWDELEEEYVRLMGNTMTKQAADIEGMKALYDLGYLPIRISAVPEGMRVNIKTPMFEIRNTVKGFGWLVNYLETYISVNIWHPMTSASIAYRYREIVHDFFEKTVDNGVESSACGDFSMRGMTSRETSFKSSAGHLLSFTGTATISAIPWLETYYNCDCTKEVVGKGVPSTEHSVMSSYGRDGEFECYRHLIEDVFKDGPLSIVSDTYDYWNVITNYLPRLKNSIMKRDGKIIIRGDSGDPVDIICGELECSDYMIIEGLSEDEQCIREYFAKKAENEFTGNAYYVLYKVRFGDNLYTVHCNYACETEDGKSVLRPIVYPYDVEITSEKITPAMKGTVELLWEIFGGTVNSKGYKVLDPHIGAIYGDSITMDRAYAIYKRLSEKGFAVNNCTLGIGSFTYQYVTRDSLGFALKATHSVVDGVERQIYKDPITDKVKGNNFKKSQRGMCYVYCDGDNILYKDGLTMKDMEKPEYSNNLLRPVFENSHLLVDESLFEIRNRLHNGKF